jgi:glyoxylase I family protein
VANLETSIAFYETAFGARVVARTAFESPAMNALMGLTEASGRAAQLQADKMCLELFEFLRPEPKPQQRTRPVCDHGITHFCIEVSDIDAEYARLSAAGVLFHCGPLDFSGGERAAYARDPDGNVIELLQTPDSVECR